MSTNDKVFANARNCHPECAWCWKQKKQWRAPEREPTIHLIEALADSANQMLVRNNFDGVSDRLNRILTVTREIIRGCEREVPTCMVFPDGTRAKCGMPLVYGRCNIHGNRYEDIKIFFSTMSSDPRDGEGRFSLD